MNYELWLWPVRHLGFCTISYFGSYACSPLNLSCLCDLQFKEIVAFKGPRSITLHSHGITYARLFLLCDNTGLWPRTRALGIAQPCILHVFSPARCRVFTFLVHVYGRTVREHWFRRSRVCFLLFLCCSCVGRARCIFSPTSLPRRFFCFMWNHAVSAHVFSLWTLPHRFSPTQAFLEWSSLLVWWSRTPSPDFLSCFWRALLYTWRMVSTFSRPDF